MRSYTTTSGDMWDYIAYKTLGNELYMCKLIEANPKYRHMTIFPAGVVLTIPEIEKAEEIRNLPPWKR